MVKLPKPPAFQSVKLVFRSKSVQDAHVLNLTTAFLDSAVEMEFWRACKLGSIDLLDRIWDASLPATEPSPAIFGPGNGGKWSRRKYLQTDRHYNRFQFRRAMVKAVKLKDEYTAFEMVGWLVDHFLGCVISVDAVQAASALGRLGIFKVFKQLEIPPRKDGGKTTRDKIHTDFGHVVRWGRRDMVQAACKSQHEAIWWLYRNTRASRAMKSVLMAAVHNGDIMLIEWLRAKYRTQGSDPDTEDEDYEVGEEEMNDKSHLCDDDERMTEVSGAEATSRDGSRFVGQLSGENAGELLREDPEEFMRETVHGGCLGVMEWLVGNGYVRKETFLAVYPAVETDRLDMVEFLIEAGRALAVAAESCSHAMAEYLHGIYWKDIVSSRCYPLTQPCSESGAPLWISSKTMALAIERGHFEFVKWLYESFSSCVDLFDMTHLSELDKKKVSVDTVAKRGNLQLLKYLHEIAVVKLTSSRKAKKARVTSKLHLSCSTEAMDQTAAGNHLDVVKWLHIYRLEDCTTRALDHAAANGHIGMMRWLSTHRSEGGTAEVMELAASKGHLSAVKWLDEHRSEGCTTAAMDSAASGGYLEMVKWLHGNWSEGCTFKAMDGAARNGHLAVVKWLHKYTNARCTHEAMDGAAANGHMKIVNWLHRHRTEDCTKAAMDEAASNGKLQVVQWLHRNRTEGCTTKAMDNAKTFEILQWL